jgi:hypothetical protein
LSSTPEMLVPATCLLLLLLLLLLLSLLEH